jgi:predicted HTH domain antitoxin
MSSSITIQFPEEILVATGQSRQEFVREAKFLLAAKLFEMGRLSSGRAARLCEMNRVEFLFAAGRARIPVIDLDDEELARELSDAR